MLNLIYCKPIRNSRKQRRKIIEANAIWWKVAKIRFRWISKDVNDDDDDGGTKLYFSYTI